MVTFLRDQLAEVTMVTFPTASVATRAVPPRGQPERPGVSPTPPPGASAPKSAAAHPLIWGDRPARERAILPHRAARPPAAPA